MRNISAGVLNVVYGEVGPPSGTPAILLHGFPYDVHAYDVVAAHLAAGVIPFLRSHSQVSEEKAGGDVPSPPDPPSIFGPRLK